MTEQVNQVNKEGLGDTSSLIEEGGITSPMRNLMEDYAGLLETRLPWSSENLQRVKNTLLAAAELSDKDQKFAQLGQAVFRQAMRVAALERRKERAFLPKEKRKTAKAAYGREMGELSEMCGETAKVIGEKEGSSIEVPSKEKMAKAMVEVVKIAVGQEKKREPIEDPKKLPSPNSVAESAALWLSRQEGKWTVKTAAEVAITLGILALGGSLLFGKIPERPKLPFVGTLGGSEWIETYTYTDSGGKTREGKLDVYDQIERDAEAFVDSLEYFRIRRDAEVDPEKDEQLQIFQAQYGLAPEDYYHWRNDPNQSRRQIEDWVKREKINKKKLKKVITPDQRRDWGEE